MCICASSMTKRCGCLIPSRVLSIVLLSMLTQRAAPGARKFLSHTQKSGCHPTVDISVYFWHACYCACTLTCKYPPPSLWSWNSLRVEHPHRPARNTGSPLAERRTVRHTTGKSDTRFGLCGKPWPCMHQQMNPPSYAFYLPLLYISLLNVSWTHLSPVCSASWSTLSSLTNNTVMKLIFFSTTSILPSLTAGIGKCHLGRWLQNVDMNSN